MITKETATDIAMAYREIETAEKLLAEIEEQIAKDWRQEPELRDVFGRRIGGLQLGVPAGKDSHRLYTLQWSLARPVIAAHIAQKRAELEALQASARAQLDHGQIATTGDATQ